MLGNSICIAGFVATFLAGRRSLAAGLGVALAFGYAYGIVRANLMQTGSFFMFDAASAGLYLSVWTSSLKPVQTRKIRRIAPWVILMSAWPCIIALLPLQDIMIQVVGLRGHIFFLPYLLIGAMIDGAEMKKLAYWLGALNIVAFGFGIGEYFLGVERFFPHNAVTQIIYMSHDVAHYTAYRIPGTFANPAGYGGVMVLALPLIVGVWAMGKVDTWTRVFLAATVAASVFGVFLCASRMQALIMILLGIVVTFTFRARVTAYLGWALILALVWWVVINSPRLQRFTQLQDASFVEQRVHWSVNQNFLDAAENYPLGVGMGGGGTSIPYFLRDRLKKDNQIAIENEWARIMLEQGVPGLAIWIAFMAWVFTRAAPARADPWFLGRRLAYCAIAMFMLEGMIGIGLFTWVPGTAMILLLMGWIAVPDSRPARVSDPFASGVMSRQFVTDRWREQRSGVRQA